MNNTLLNAIEAKLNTTTTWNGAKAHESTKNANLDFFGKVGSVRNSSSEASKLFANALNEDVETAVRILFYARDIRGGQGERKVFRDLLRQLAIRDANLAKKLVIYIPMYGRWDDAIYAFEGTEVWNTVLENIKLQLKADLNTEVGKNISLLAKWLPSINSSSKNSKRIGRKIAEYLGLNERMYRKTLTVLRNQIGIVETKMCGRKWEEVVYENLPSRAIFMYRKAFKKHDSSRYENYLSLVSKGEAKINASTMYPYDLIAPFLNNYSYINSSEEKLLESQWNALPNYMEGNFLNGLVLCDVSGSMYSCYSGGKIRPIDVSISLSMYIAERNTGIWKDHFLSFATNPELVKVTGETLREKVRSVVKSTSNWGSTNLQSAISLILNTGIDNNLSNEEMPKMIIIISDMQFNRSCSSNKKTNFDTMKEKYASAGYDMPNVVFWNVNSASNVPMQYDDTGTCLVSGCSPSILKSVLRGDSITPLSMMRDVVYASRYDPIGEVFS